ncbi:Cmc4 protein [Martiniozyma asiatica (nom. inval.)]|nr:Cmc4 protein [Martiniozyma asiatica]
MPDACKPQACAIQNCLKSNGYNESKCTAYIDALYACCTEFYSTNAKGQEGRTPCCPIPRLLKFKIEQRQKEDLDANLAVQGLR